MPSSSTKTSFKGSGVYEIRARGYLGPEWSVRFGGMEMLSTGGPEGGDRVILSGPLQDQSELLGVLNTLYDLHLPIESVQFKKL